MSRSLRILHVTPYYENAWAYGGIPRLAAGLVRGLAARGHQVSVCTTDACARNRRLARPPDATAAGRGWRLTPAPGVDVFVFPNVSNRLAYDRQFFVPLGLDGFLRQHITAFDLAHLHACRNLPGVWAARACRRAGVPYVLAPNGTAPPLERHFALKRAFDAVAGRAVLDGAARVLAVSEAERRQLLATGVASSRIAVMPNPVDLAEFEAPRHRGAFRERAGLGRAPLVLFLGRLSPRKHVDVLVHAVARLEHSEAVLGVAGTDVGAEASVRRAVGEAGLAARTVFTGLLEGPARLDAVADADVVVYAGAHEVFGLVACESLLSGTPVVVADDSGCGEVIARVGGGLCVPPGDAAALAAALRSVLAKAGAWGERARAAGLAVRQAFGPGTVCRQLDEVYQDVARQR